MSFEGELLGKKAFIVFYDDDLSSRGQVVCTVDNNVISDVKRSKLAIVVTKERSDKGREVCIYHVISGGNRVGRYDVECPYVFDSQSVLRRDYRSAENLSTKL
ncbi:MAG: hypothetical protein QW284_00030 [Ignisphaera sp.]